MRKKVNICVIVSIVLSLVLFSFACYYLSEYIGSYKRNLEAITSVHRTPEDIKRLTNEFWNSYKPYFINFSIMMLFSIASASLLTIVLIWVNKAEIDYSTSSIQTKIQTFREKRHQKKIEKAKALLESEDKKDD